ncbi:MAG: hypothetical protein WC758_05090 [Candidatus Woesearchaeota archaeon]|jgi:hypothetical protein
MGESYHNYTPTEMENALVRYMSNQVLISQTTKSGDILRTAKIIVHVVLKLHLPIKLSFYNMGIHSAVRPSFEPQYDAESDKPYIDEALASRNVSEREFLDTINEAIRLFTENMSGNDIRRKQYELLKDELYLSQLNIELFLQKRKWSFDEHNSLIQLVAKLLVELPDNRGYEEFTQDLFTCTSLISASSYFLQKNEHIYKNISQLLLDALAYLDALNTKYHRIAGYEELFISCTQHLLDTKKQALSASIFKFEETLKSSNMDDTNNKKVLSEAYKKAYPIITNMLIEND